MKITIILFFFTALIAVTFSQEQKNLDKFLTKQKALEIQINEIEYINQKLQRVIYSGSYFDKYRALSTGMEICKVSPDFLNVLNFTFQKYENFKKHKDDLIDVEKQLFSLQFKLTTNEEEYYRLLKVRRAKNDILDSLEMQIDTLMRSTITKFVAVTDSALKNLRGEKNSNKELSGILKIIQNLKEMDKTNALSRINDFYTFPMDKKGTDEILSILIETADSVVCHKSDTILQEMSQKEFLNFVVDYIKIKERFSYSPNAPVLSSFDVMENKFAYYSEQNFRNFIKNSVTIDNCLEIVSVDSSNGNQRNEIRYYVRNQPITNDEVNLFYISQKEFTTFNFEEKLDTELRNRIMNYFSVWSGYDIMTQEDKKFIIGLLGNSATSNDFKTKFKSTFNIQSDEDLVNFLVSNEFYKVSIGQVRHTGQE